ncbi:glycosyltransferase family 1 protein [Teredinibacter turnerae]|uniref:glycosyltransferase family 4 protein n=1 Tax=Teredinibacter turnerae TaxID=2426 RepID=UPI0030CE5F2C
MFKPKILFDARYIGQGYSGLARYTYELLTALMKERHLYESLIVVVQENKIDHDELLSKLMVEINVADGVSFVAVRSHPFSLRSYFLDFIWIRKFKGYDYFYPHFNIPLFTGGFAVIHDLFPLKVSGYFTSFSKLKASIFYIIIFFTLLLAKKVFCVSFSTMRDVKSLFPFFICSRLQVVLSGFSPPADWKQSSGCAEFQNLREKYNIPHKKYLFYVGDRRPHKNLQRTLSIFMKLREEYSYDGVLVVAGSEKNYDFNLEDAPGIFQYVYPVGRVSDDDLGLFYANMDAMLFLSKYEGFGLPVLEAAFFGKKIITSKGSSLVEVAPDEALLVDLASSDSRICAEILRYLNDHNRLTDVSKHLTKFSWGRTAEEIFKLN